MAKFNKYKPKKKLSSPLMTAERKGALERKAQRALKRGVKS